MCTNEMTSTMLYLQSEMNKRVDIDWKTKKHDWKLAIIQELSESIDSFPWKWWKNVDDTTPDIDNLIVEIVDVWHFVLSIVLENEFENEFDDMIEVANSTKFQIDEYPISILKKAIHTSSSDWSNEEVVDQLVYYIFKLMTYLGMTYEDLYKYYITKNVLNLFRQGEGYKDGDYIKDWNGEEDNVVAFRLALEIESGDYYSIANELMGSLEQYYESNVKNKRNFLSDVLRYIKRKIS